MPACLHGPYVVASPFGGRKRALDSLELGSQAVLSYLMWVQGTKPRSLVGAPVLPWQLHFCCEDTRPHEVSWILPLGGIRGIREVKKSEAMLTHP